MKYIQKLFSSLGTLNNITLYFDEKDSKKANIVMQNIEDYCNELDDKLSIFKENSEINKINNNASIQFIQVSKDTFEIIKLAKEFGKMTNGAFDITVKPLVDLWTKSRKENVIPNDKNIKDFLRKVNYNNIILNDKDNSVMLKNEGQSIDLGGIAKGYIIDKIKEILKYNEFNNAIINLGGTVSSIGEKRTIGIRNPFTPMNSDKEVQEVMEVESIDEDIVTSGIYEQFINKDGKIYHHILNPTTGYPTETKIVSATLIGKNGAELDSIATACFTLGIEKSSKLVKKQNINAIFILDDGKLFYTESLKNRIIMKEK